MIRASQRKRQLERRIVALEKAGQLMLAALAGVDPATITEWKGKNGKADKLRTWCDSIQAACDALRAVS